MSETPQDQSDANADGAARNSEEACLDQLKRERADFLNYKRRVDRDRADERERVRLETLRSLLPAIDDLDRALKQMPPDLRGHAWAEGVALAHQRFLDTLRNLGVERIGNQGERFDPAVHEAVAYYEEPSAREQHIESVMRPGYRIGSQLLRPAQVVVTGPPRNGAAGPAAGGPQGTQERQDAHGQSYRY